MRILIFGAAGFIGSHLTRYLSQEGHDVVALCRSGEVSGFEGVIYPWSLGQQAPIAALKAANCAIHLAHDFDGEEGAQITVEGTLSCISELRANGIHRHLFFSSYSAGPHACSIYSRTKFAIEQKLVGSEDVVIVRPGLVLGDGGLYGRINKWARLLPLIPLPDGGAGKVPVISIERLCRETLTMSCADEIPQEAGFFERDLHSLLQLVLDAAAKSGKHPWVLPVPSKLVLIGLRLAEFMHLPLPVNSDNLIGFLSNQNAVHVSTLRDEDK